jgi:hypothetical protein
MATLAVGKKGTGKHNGRHYEERKVLARNRRGTIVGRKKETGYFSSHVPYKMKRMLEKELKKSKWNEAEPSMAHFSILHQSSTGLGSECHENSQ